MQHRDQYRKALYPQLVQVHAAQYRHADGAKSRGAVVHVLQPEHTPGDEIAKKRIHPAAESPLFRHAAAADISAADGEVGAFGECGDQSWHILGLVGKVGIHLYDDIGAEHLDRVADAAHVGDAQPRLRAFKKMHAAARLLNGAHSVAGSVGRPVIHDEDFDAAGQRSAGRPQLVQ